MVSKPVTEEDRALLDRATDTIKSFSESERHKTGVALRTGSGIYTGISMRAFSSASDVHAEPIALARAVLDGANEFDTLAAVQATGGDDFQLVTACGSCRELLLAFDPELLVVVPGDDDMVKKPMKDLLPDRDWKVKAGR